MKVLPHRDSHRRLPLALVGALFLLIQSLALANDLHWSGTAGASWTVAANWRSPSGASVTAAPNALDDIYINTPSYAAINTTNARVRNMFVGYASGSSGYLKIGPATNARLITSGIVVLGGSAGAYGSVEVTGGDWTTSGYTLIGQSGSGTLTVTTGIVTVNQYTVIGNNPGSSGKVIINGGTYNTAQETYVGLNGTGFLSVGGNGKVNAGTSPNAGDNPNFLVNAASTVEFSLSTTRTQGAFINTQGPPAKLDIGSTLSLLNLSAWNANWGDTYTLITSENGFNGTFSNLRVNGAVVSLVPFNATSYQFNLGTGWLYVLNYTGGTNAHDLTLQRIEVQIPEPGTWAMLVGGLSALAMLRRRG